MKVLVLEPKSDGSSQVTAVVRDSGYPVVQVADTGALAGALDNSGSAVIACVPAIDASSIENIRSAARVTASKKALLFVLAKTARPEDDALAYDAGADCVISGAHSGPQVLSRVRFCERTVARLVSDTAARPATIAPAVAAESSVVDKCFATKAWRDAPKAFATAATQMLGIPMSAADPAVAPRPLVYCNSVTLLSAQQELEVRIAVGASTACARVLANHMFGGEGDDLTADLLSEMANIFMGTIKATLNGEGYAFAAGLPQAIPSDQLTAPSVTFQHQATLSLMSANAGLFVYLGLRSKGNVAVASNALKEGMVLAKDIHNGKGLLLLTKGTRLSTTMIERLATSLPPKMVIEVAS